MPRALDLPPSNKIRCVCEYDTKGRGDVTRIDYPLLAFGRCFRAKGTDEGAEASKEASENCRIKSNPVGYITESSK